jgi:hypothetical protein
MTGARRRALLILCVLALVGGALAFAVSRREPPRSRPAAQRPALMLLTTLPLLFGEEFSLKGGGSPALEKLETRYRVVPISVSSAPELSKGRLLLMAQPLAQTPEDLVALDNWVRGGGRLLLLADPMLEWPSKRPLGDALRPPPMFADTGLLAHWGLRLDAPDERGLVVVGVDVYPMVYVSPGRLASAHSNCLLSRADVVADCKIGMGRVVVVADADFLNPELAKRRNPTIDNIAALMDLLDSLQQ